MNVQEEMLNFQQQYLLNYELMNVTYKINNMANKTKGLKRKAIKKKYDKWKRIEKNNLPSGQHFRLTCLKDLRKAELKSKKKIKK